MPSCYFVSDLHGIVDRFEKLFARLLDAPPSALFIGGDLLPSALSLHGSQSPAHVDFINDFLVAELLGIKQRLGSRYPRVFVILGNDDGRFQEAAMLDAAALGVWEYIHNRSVAFGSFTVYGYSYIPPSPFLLKDWERYDVSRYVDPGAVSPEEGAYSVPVDYEEKRYATIEADLRSLFGDADLSRAIVLFHTPPHDTKLDHIETGGRLIDHVPIDPHVGSIAVSRFIEARQPLLTLHGHVHESARLTGSWKQQLGRTLAISAAHDGPELALVEFDPEGLSTSSRCLL